MKRPTVISKDYTVKPCKLYTECVQNACKMKEKGRKGRIEPPQEKKSTCRKMLFVATCCVDMACTKHIDFFMQQCTIFFSFPV